MAHTEMYNKKLLRALFAVFLLICLGSVAGDFFIEKHHVSFPHESSPGFYGAYGFISFAFLVAVSKYLLRPLVSRKEDYYD